MMSPPSPHAALKWEKNASVRRQNVFGNRVDLASSLEVRLGYVSQGQGHVCGPVWWGDLKLATEKEDAYVVRMREQVKSQKQGLAGRWRGRLERRVRRERGEREKMKEGGRRGEGETSQGKLMACVVCNDGSTFHGSCFSLMICPTITSSSTLQYLHHFKYFMGVLETLSI